MADTGWICLHRKILDWQWWDNPRMVKFWIYLLLKANHEDSEYKGTLVKRGQFISTLKVMANENRMTIDQIRGCLRHLKNDHNITTQITNRNTIITICQYESYQDQPLRESQANPTQLTTEIPHIQQINNIKEKDITKVISKKKEKISVEGDAPAPTPKPTREEILKEKRAKFIADLKPYVEEYGRDMINDFYRYWGEAFTHTPKLRYEGEKTWSLSMRLKRWQKHDHEKYRTQ